MRYVIVFHIFFQKKYKLDSDAANGVQNSCEFCSLCRVRQVFVAVSGDFEYVAFHEKMTLRFKLVMICIECITLSICELRTFWKMLYSANCIWLQISERTNVRICNNGRQYFVQY